MRATIAPEDPCGPHPRRRIAHLGVLDVGNGADCHSGPCRGRPVVVGHLHDAPLRVEQDVVQDVRVGGIGPDHVGVQMIGAARHVEPDRCRRLRAVRWDRCAGRRGRHRLGHGRVQLMRRAQLTQPRRNQRGSARGVVDTQLLGNRLAAAARHVKLRRSGDQRSTGVAKAEPAAAHRRARHLLGGAHGGIDVDEPGALLASGRVDVGRRPVQDLLDHCGRRRSTAVGVTVRLDHVGGRPRDERGRLACPPEGLSQTRHRGATRAGRRTGGGRERAAGGLAAVAGRHQVDVLPGSAGHRERLPGAGGRQGRDVVVDPAVEPVSLRQKPQRVRRADPDHVRVVRWGDEGVVEPLVAGRGDDHHAALNGRVVGRPQGVAPAARAVGLRDDVGVEVGYRVLHPGDDRRRGLTDRRHLDAVVRGDRGCRINHGEIGERRAGCVALEHEGAVRRHVGIRQLGCVVVDHGPLCRDRRSVPEPLVQRGIVGNVRRVVVRGVLDDVLAVGAREVRVAGELVHSVDRDHDALAIVDRVGLVGPWPLEVDVLERLGLDHRLVRLTRAFLLLLRPRHVVSRCGQRHRLGHLLVGNDLRDAGQRREVLCLLGRHLGRDRVDQRQPSDLASARLLDTRHGLSGISAMRT